MHAWRSTLHVLAATSLSSGLRSVWSMWRSKGVLVYFASHQCLKELTVHVLLPWPAVLQLYINKLSGLRHHLMKGMAAEALWESTFLTQILTLERWSDATRGKIRRRVSGRGCAASTGLCLCERECVRVHACARLKDNCRALETLAARDIFSSYFIIFRHSDRMSCVSCSCVSITHCKQRWMTWQLRQTRSQRGLIAPWWLAASSGMNSSPC